MKIMDKQKQNASDSMSTLDDAQALMEATSNMVGEKAQSPQSSRCGHGTWQRGL